jgi:glycosyltransferase involved in cell wall biosynthesis
VAWIFDMRGFWADERVEGGLWSERSVLYRLVKRLERWFLADADAIVTLTERAAATVRGWTGRPADHVTVIPTCVDLARFQWAGNSSVNGSGPRFVYAGSVGTWYCLDHVFQFFARARERFPNAELVILTRNVEEARASLARVAAPAGAVTIKSVEPHEIPAHIAGAYTGLAFYKPGFARQATCPTKIGEYLALGVPVVTNAAVGDVVSLVGGNDVGAVIEGFDAAAYDAALDSLERLWRDAVLRARCRTLAESAFSLQLGVARYGSIYERVTVR